MCVQDGIFWFTTIQQTIQSALAFADEVIVTDGGSMDGTVEMIQNEFGGKVKIIDDSQRGHYFMAMPDRRTVGLHACTGDYCVLMDSDEVIGEWDAEKIRNIPYQFPDAIAFHFQTLHFYRAWNRIQTKEGWYQHKIYMIKNGLGIKHGPVRLDRDNFVFSNGKPVDDPLQIVLLTDITVFHYGWCRPDHVLLLKKWRQEIEWWGVNYWKSHPFPFKFDNPNNLKNYNGRHPKWMDDLITEKWRWIKEFNNDYERFPWRDER